MALLNFQFQDALTGIHDYLEKLKDFAQAQGWTVDNFIQNTQWAFDTVDYQFISGTESFLQLSSNGYGSQNLVFRFRAENTGAVGDHEWLQMGAHKATTFDHSNSTHPDRDWET